MRSLLKSESAQTSFEYVLILVVVMIMVISVMGKVRERLIGTAFPCPDKDPSLGCRITRVVSSFGSSGPNYRFFTLR